MRGASRKWSGAVWLWGAAALFLASASAGMAQERGMAEATGSDSLSLHGKAYQLFGIDGLEFNQHCFAEGRAWACGVSAVRALQTLLASAPVNCTPRGVANLARCTSAEEDIALELVEQGWALARPGQTTDYVAAETAAREAQAGAWRGSFLTPEEYRQRVAAIEARYAGLAAESARDEAEARIEAGLDLGGLVTEVVIAEGDGFEERELRFGGFAPGFLNGAIQPPAVFEWPKVASVLEGTRREGLAAVDAGVTEFVLGELAKLPARTVDTRTEDDFHAALKAGAAEWIAAGRQPVLFVMAPDLPSWIRQWFAGQAPAGAEVIRQTERGTGYLGTVDGIDVYVGPGRERAALLVPADLLSSLTFRRDASGHVLAAAVDDRNEWVLRYGIALEWQADPVVWLTFPQKASATPDAE